MRAVMRHDLNYLECRKALDMFIVPLGTPIPVSRSSLKRSFVFRARQHACYLCAARHRAECSRFNVRCGTIATILVGWGVVAGGILGVAMHLLRKRRKRVKPQD